MVKKPRTKKVMGGLGALYAPKPIKKAPMKKRKAR